jgi:hypothetical protein
MEPGELPGIERVGTFFSLLQAAGIVAKTP